MTGLSQGHGHESRAVRPSRTEFQMKSRITRTQSGAVLLESVIAIPLYLLLIGGIMWIGQLIYDKQKLVISDRYVAWNAGNRHQSTLGDAQRQFFDTGGYDKVNSPASNKWGQGNWWHFVYGEVSLEAKMPPWTRGPMMADAIMKGRKFWLPEKTQPYYGRLSLDGTKAGGHSVVMRRDKYPSDTRDETPGVNTDPMGINFDPEKGIPGESYPNK